MRWGGKKHLIENRMSQCSFFFCQSGNAWYLGFLPKECSMDHSSIICSPPHSTYVCTGMQSGCCCLLYCQSNRVINTNVHGQPLPLLAIACFASFLCCLYRIFLLLLCCIPLHFLFRSFFSTDTPYVALPAVLYPACHALPCLPFFPVICPVLSCPAPPYWAHVCLALPFPALSYSTLV